MQTNLTSSKDWIVLSQTMNTLGKWDKKDEILKIWMLTELKKISNDMHKSVSSKAKKYLAN